MITFFFLRHRFIVCYFFGCIYKSVVGKRPLKESTYVSNEARNVRWSLLCMWMFVHLELIHGPFMKRSEGRSEFALTYNGWFRNRFDYSSIYEGEEVRNNSFVLFQWPLQKFWTKWTIPGSWWNVYTQWEWKIYGISAHDERWKYCYYPPLRPTVHN